MAKRPPETNRRALIEQQRKKARAKERRATLLTIGITSLLGIAMLVAIVAFGVGGGGGSDTELRLVGATAEAAGCGESKEEEIAKDNGHVGSAVQYAVTPPTSGQHHPSPLPVGAKKFYSRDENPPPERAVHNLEHGYIVVWYDSKVPEDQIKLLEQAADGAEGKFLIVPWTRGDFAGDKHIVLTSWGQKMECSSVSGAAMQTFQDNHGGQKSKAPEKNAI